MSLDYTGISYHIDIIYQRLFHNQKQLQQYIQILARLGEQTEQFYQQIYKSKELQLPDQKELENLIDVPLCLITDICKSLAINNHQLNNKISTIKTSVDEQMKNIYNQIKTYNNVYTKQLKKVQKMRKQIEDLIGRTRQDFAQYKSLGQSDEKKKQAMYKWLLQQQSQQRQLVEQCNGEERALDRVAQSQAPSLQRLDGERLQLQHNLTSQFTQVINEYVNQQNQLVTKLQDYCRCMNAQNDMSNFQIQYSHGGRRSFVETAFVDVLGEAGAGGCEDQEAAGLAGADAASGPSKSAQEGLLIFDELVRAQSGQQAQQRRDTAAPKKMEQSFSGYAANSAPAQVPGGGRGGFFGAAPAQPAQQQVGCGETRENVPGWAPQAMQPAAPRYVETIQSHTGFTEAGTAQNKALPSYDGRCGYYTAIGGVQNGVQQNTSRTSDYYYYGQYGNVRDHNQGAWNGQDGQNW